MQTIYERLRTMLVKEYKLNPEQLTLDTPLETLCIDSLGLAHMLFNVEDTFLVILPTEPVLLSTLGDVVKFIDGLIAAQSGRIVHSSARAARTAEALQPA